MLEPRGLLEPFKVPKEEANQGVFLIGWRPLEDSLPLHIILKPLGK